MLRAERLGRFRSGGALLLAGALAACGAAPAPAGTEEPAGDAAPRPGRASHYGGPIAPVTLSGAERAAVGVSAGCRVDPRLVLAARVHARELSASGGGHAGTDVDHLRFAVLAAGGIDYRIQPFVASADAAGREALAGFVRDCGAGWSHCGAGVSGEVLVWIGVRRPLETDALPIRLPAGERARMNGRVLDPRVRRIEAFWGLPDGAVRRLEVREGGGRFDVELPPARPGRHDLELLADDGSGPEVAALLPIWVGVEPDPRPIVFQEPDSGSERPATELLYELIDDARRRAGLAPLVRDGSLEAVALSHSAEMAERGFFGHVSPSTGALEDRLAARGLRPQASAENLARSGSVFRAHRNLLQSPSHRMLLVDPGFTCVGAGTARDGDDVIVTEVFARW